MYGIPEVGQQFNQEKILKITFYHKAGVFTPGALTGIGEALQAIVAEAGSSPWMKIEAQNVEWFPTPFEEGHRGSEFGIELEVEETPETKARFNKEATQLLKSKMIKVEGFPKVNPNAPILWVKFIEGHHA
ncbi:MAG: hypothetical protein JWO73_534 [Candidatus Taylorbacteria bacterium]|nr:hypothetical protein [Candidatus Taylorbacteria bacterium]